MVVVLKQFKCNRRKQPQFSLRDHLTGGSAVQLSSVIHQIILCTILKDLCSYRSCFFFFNSFFTVEITFLKLNQRNVES